MLKCATAGLAGLALTVPVLGAPPASGALQNILQNTHNSPAYEYPTDLTRGIIPVRISGCIWNWGRIGAVAAC